jgi:hypothetical protein
MDDNGFVLSQDLNVKVICHRSQKNPCYTQDGNLKTVIVIECIAADGRVILPIYIYKGGKHLLGWNAGVQDKEQATFAWSTTGWTDNELGLE